MFLDGWFNEITCHLFFSSMFFLGCSTALLIRWVNLILYKSNKFLWLLNNIYFNKPNPKIIKIISFFKSVLMIAFYMFCNFEPNYRKHINVYIKNGMISLAYSYIFFFNQTIQFFPRLYLFDCFNYIFLCNWPFDMSVNDVRLKVKTYFSSYSLKLFIN